MASLTPMDVKFYEGKSLVEVRVMYRNFVNAMKFEEAKVAKVAMANIKEAKGASTMDSIKSEIRKAVVEAKKVWDVQIEEIQGQNKAEEMNIREKIASTFEALQITHKEQLVENEKKFAIEILRSLNRPVRAQIELETQAVKLGHEGDLDGAIKLRGKGEQAREAELKQRRKNINDIFAENRNIITEKQKRELLLLTEKLRRNLHDAQTSTNEKLLEKEKIFVVSVKNEEQKQINQNELKPEDVDCIHKYLKSTVKEVTGREDLLDDQKKEEDTPKSKKDNKPQKGSIKKGSKTPEKGAKTSEKAEKKPVKENQA